MTIIIRPSLEGFVLHSSLILKHTVVVSFVVCLQYAPLTNWDYAGAIACTCLHLRGNTLSGREGNWPGPRLLGAPSSDKHFTVWRLSHAEGSTGMSHVTCYLSMWMCTFIYDCPMGRGPVYNMLDSVRTPFSRKTVYTWGWHFTFWTSVIFDSPWCIMHQAEINTSALMPSVSCDLICLAHQITTKNWHQENSIQIRWSQVSVKASFCLARSELNGSIWVW